MVVLGTSSLQLKVNQARRVDECSSRGDVVLSVYKIYFIPEDKSNLKRFFFL